MINIDDFSEKRTFFFAILSKSLLIVQLKINFVGIFDELGGKMEGEIKVRAALKSDVSALARLSTQLGYESSVVQTEKRLEKIAQIKEQTLIVAEHPEFGVLGFIHLEQRFLIEREPLLEIAALVVDEEHRSKGIGKILLSYANDFAAQNDLKTVMLRSGIHREAAHAFYERNGFRITSRSVKMERVG